ncbi:MAG: RHS repeat domain-containing protein [Nannocystales bacterium]
MFTTSEGRETAYAFQRQGTDYERSVTFPDGTVTASVLTPEQDQVTYADGTVVTTQWEANERLGANTRAPASIRTQTPGAGDRVVTFVREFEPRCTVYTEDAECGDPPVELPNLRADRISETAQSGSETWTRVYDRAHIDGGSSVAATIVSTAPSGRVTTTTLNGDGQVASLQVGTLAPVIYSYDARGRVSGISQTDGLEVRGVTFGYHATEGWLETVTDSENRTTTYQRDEVGRVLQQIAPNTEVVSFTYDEDGNVESVTPPSRPAHDFFYDSADRLREYAPPAVSGVPDPETQYTYTPDHQPAVTSLPQSSDITYTHDVSTGKLSTIATPEALYTFVHDDDGGVDDTGQLQSASIDPDAMGMATNTLTYTYDGDLLTGEAMTGDVTGSVSWGYDSQRRLDSETAAGDTVAYGYDSQGRMTSMGAMTATYVPTTGQLDTTTVSGVLATYSYDPFGDLAGILYEDGATAVYEVTYTRDSYGRIETKTETHSGSTSLRCYEYDDADRLADVYDAADSMGCTGTNLESYSYDSNGNRSTVTNSAGTIGAGGVVTDNQDRLLTHGDWTYTYNDDGQMDSRTDTSSGDVWLYTYDAVGNLLEVDPPGTTAGTITYIIDARNRRVGREVDGVEQHFLYGDQLNPVAELDGAGALVSRFVYGASDHVPDYMVRGGTTYRFLTDQNGNVVGVFNTTTNTMAQTREYDAYGRVVGGATTEAGFSQPFGFAGGLYDEDTGLVRFGARDYRPEVGSWAAKDPLRFGGGAASLMQYCLGDPLNFVDPHGQAPLFPLPAGGASPLSGAGHMLIVGNTTWGGLQTILGSIASIGGEYDLEHAPDGVVMVRGGWINAFLPPRSAMTLGPFIFLNECDPNGLEGYYGEVPLWEHERGHTAQSALMGPAYIPAGLLNYLFYLQTYKDGSPLDRNANDWANNLR